MGRKILKVIHHYGIWQFALLGLGIYGLNSVLHDHFEFIVHFGQATVAVLSGIILSFCILFWIIFFLGYLQHKVYADKTDGRIYFLDHRRYKRTYTELVEYFKDADPYKMDEEQLPEEDWTKADGIILGKKGKKLIKRSSFGVGNLAVFSLPGGGKTTSQIIPSAMRFSGSVLAIDIKGDILHYTKDKRKIKIFSPDDPANSCHFDPLAGIRKMDISERRTFIELISMVLVEDEPDGKYFTDGGRDFFCGIALYMLHDNPRISFPGIVHAILQGNAFNWVTDVIVGNCSEAKDYLASYMGNNEKNVAGCYNTLVKAVRPFSAGSLSSLLDGSGDCITPETLEDGYDVYIEIPQDRIKFYAPVTTIIVQNFMTAFMKRPDMSSYDGLRRILFLLDEFPQLHFDFDTLTAGLSTLRSKGVSLFLAQQSIAQISKRYGDDGCREIIDTCAYISVMSAQDPKSRVFFQELIGTRKALRIQNSVNPREMSRSVQEVREPVFQPEDFGNLEDDVIIYANGKYIRAQKTYCWRSAELQKKDRCH